MQNDKKKVLIIDDNDNDVMYLCILLDRMNFDVVPARNGLEALKLLKTTTPDLILIDADRRLTDVSTTLKHITNDKRLSMVPVVTISAKPEAEARATCKEHGCDSYIMRPIKIDTLHRMLEETVYAAQGWQRKYPRAYFNIKVRLTHDGMMRELYSQTVAEGGMYIRMKDPLPLGSEVKVDLPIGEGLFIELDGTVIYSKGLYGDVFSSPPGIAVEFKDVTDEDSLLIMDYISRLVAEEILEYQG